MRPGRFGMAGAQRFGLSPGELDPVNGTAVQVINGQGMDGHPMIFQGCFRMPGEYGDRDNEPP